MKLDSKTLIQAVRGLVASGEKAVVAVPVVGGAYGAPFLLALGEDLDGASHFEPALRPGAVLGRLLAKSADSWTLVSVGRSGKKAAERARRIGEVADLVTLPFEGVFSVGAKRDVLSTLWTSEAAAA